MPIKLFDSPDAIPEPLRKSAVETKDGKFAISEEEDVTPLKETLRKERERAETAEKERKRLEAERAELEIKAKAAAAGLTDEQVKKLRDDVRADLDREYAPFKEKATEFESLQRKVRLDDPIKETMLSEAVGVRGERQAALWKLIGDRFELTSDGKPMVKDHPGISVEKYLAEDVKKEFPEFYKGTQAAGGGAGGSQAGGGSAPAKKPTEWTSAERATFIEKNGSAAYRKLLDEQLREGVKAKSA